MSEERRKNGHGRRTGGRGGRGGRFAHPTQRNRMSARDVALEVLSEVEQEDAYANLVLPGRLREARLDTREAALATELSYGTMRGIGFYDAVVEKAADRVPADLDPLTRSAVRLGVHQLLNMRVANHAAVSETVDALRGAGGGRASGLVNAVLRRVSEQDREAWTADLLKGRSADDALALETSHPAWIVRAFRQALRGHGRGGEGLDDALRTVLDANNTPAKVSLAALPGLMDPAQLAQHDAVTEAALSPIGLVLETGDPRDVPGVDEATVRVQDQGSQLVALALAHAEDAESPAWLDLCAGPGGKTAVLSAIAAGRGGRVAAIDSSEHRAQLVRQSTKAVRDTVEVIHADGREHGAGNSGAYSGVLVDVPCTGLGALRRRPEARWRRRPEDVAQLAPLQLELLEAAITACRPGGIIAYSTCSPHWAETAVIVDDAVRSDRVDVLDAPAVLAEITGDPAESFASAVRGDGRFAQMWPDIHGTDGMFLALLRRR